MTGQLPTTEVSAALDDAIAAAGGKQSHLAQKLGCAQQTVSKLRTGEIPMTADWALRIAAALDQAVPPGRLFPKLASLGTGGEAGQTGSSPAATERVPA